MKIKGIHHITIRVPDPAASRRWYEEVLGFQFLELPVDERSTDIWKGHPKAGTMLASQVGGLSSSSDHHSRARPTTTASANTGWV